MENTSELPAQPWRIGPGMVLLIGAGALIVLLCLIAAGAWMGSQRRLAEAREVARTGGDPLSAEELESYYVVPPADQDTTQIWLAAIAPLDTPEFKADAEGLPFMAVGPDEIPWPSDPWPQLEPAARLLSKYASSLEGMHEAARKGARARFPIRFAEGMAMLLPHAQQLRMGARLLDLEAVVMAHQGRPDAAVESTIAMFAAARSLEQEPVIVSQLVRSALGSMARHRVVWLLSAVTLDDGQLGRFATELAAGDYQQAMRRAAVGERALGTLAFADPASVDTAAPHTRLGLPGGGDETMYLQIMGRMIRAFDATGPARQEAAEQAEAQLKELAGARGAAFRYPITLSLLPAFSACVVMTNRSEADRDATRVAIAIERFRRDENRLPSTLDELVSKKYLESLPNDPFDGQNLRYRIDADEYLVYSAGSNGVDDGGSSDPPNQPADLVVRVRLRGAKQ
ncbi:MAG TPA: hypothetical protein VHC22_21405 [Pirellulales bacterium]|nr:hypothetical protein [Pirellulales bacterium]